MKCLLIIGVCAFIFLVARADDDGCTDGQTKKDDDNCNSCFCTKGVWACTRKQCNGPVLTIKNKRETSCTDGDRKLDSDQCNECHCSSGVWACTQKLCLPKPQN